MIISDGQEKTQDPTAKKLLDAREKGSIAKSPDLAVSVSLLVCFLLFYFWAGGAMLSFGQFAKDILINLSAPIDDPEFVIAYLKKGVYRFISLLFPLFATMLASVLLANLAQTRGLFALSILSPHWNKINPLAGENYKKIFSLSSVIKVFLGFLRLCVTVLIGSFVVVYYLDDILFLPAAPLSDSVYFILFMAMQIGIMTSFAYLLAGLVDYFFQCWQYKHTLRMSFMELQEEQKLLEGGQVAKQNIQSLLSTLLKRKNKEGALHADVLVAGAQNYAVSLKIHRKIPVCVAKETSDRAKRLLYLAERDKVPIVENYFLAEALFRDAEVYRDIPPLYYEGVAKALIQARKV